MAHTKSAKKRLRQSHERHVRNQSVMSRVRTFIKKADQALTDEETSGAAEAVTAAISEIDRAAKKGVLHPNNAARKKSSLQRRLHAGS